mmetsp:Transcript_9560/g.23454  ORF Transcript_9560/g.23454 Transcript_9560/m.23454 type:complete len:214 (-) Transcript_9560:1594-2235(-)
MSSMVSGREVVLLEILLPAFAKTDCLAVVSCENFRAAMVSPWAERSVPTLRGLNMLSCRDEVSASNMSSAPLRTFRAEDLDWKLLAPLAKELQQLLPASCTAASPPVAVPALLGLVRFGPKQAGGNFPMSRRVKARIPSPPTPTSRSASRSMWSYSTPQNRSPPSASRRSDFVIFPSLSRSSRRNIEKTSFVFTLNFEHIVRNAVHATPPRHA